MDEPKQYKYITKEIIKNGSIEIRSTPEDMEKLSEVNEYNRYMKECRAKMQELKHLRNAYLAMNVFAIGCLMLTTFASSMMFVQDKQFWVKFFVSVFLIVVYAVIYFLFSFSKNELEFFPNVLMTATFLYINPDFLYLLILNIVFCGIYRYKKGCLGEEIGYPLFYDLRVDRIRGKTYDSQVKVPVYSEVLKKIIE